MKKLRKSAFLATAAAIAAVPILGVADVNAAASVSYSDFGNLNAKTLNGAYAHTKVYYKDNTVITVKKAAGNATVGQVIDVAGGAASVTHILDNQTLTVLIENSTATDNEGNDVDVLYRVSDVHRWSNEEVTDTETGTTTPKSFAGLSFASTVYGSTSAEHPTQEGASSHQSLSAGDPIVVWNNTRYADSLFSVEFCKKGTYDASSDSCTAAGLTSLSAAMWDFDVPNGNRQKEGDTFVKENGSYVYTEYGDQLMHGNEGIMPQDGTNTIYMNQNKTLTDSTEISTESNGYSVQNINNGAKFDGIWFGNSLMVTATNLSGSWSYRYSGTTCGIGVIFGSAVPYQMPDPVKTVDKTSAMVGDKVTYTIKQEVPNNYTSEADMVTFMSLHSNYDNIRTNKGYSSFKITDTFQDGLQLPKASEVVITDEKGNNVTDLFTIEIDGQNFSATAKDATAITLYGHTFTITIGTTVTSDVTISPVENTAKTIYTPNNDSSIPEEFSSNTVETGLVRKVTTKYVDDKTGKEIAGSTSASYPQGSDYTTNKLSKVPKGYELVKVPANAKGTIGEKDITVIYRYRKITNPKTFDAGTTAFVGAAIAGIVGGGLFFGLKRRR